MSSSDKVQEIREPNEAIPFFLAAIKHCIPIPREPENYATLQEALYALRAQSKLTLDEIASLVNMSQQGYSHIEMGRSNMDPDNIETLKDLARDLHMPVLEKFLHYMVIHLRRNPRKGRKIQRYGIVDPLPTNRRA